MSEPPRAKRARITGAAAEAERQPELVNHERQLEMALLRQLLERRPLSTRELLTKFRAKLVRAGHRDASIAALSSRLPDLIRVLAPSQNHRRAGTFLSRQKSFSVTTLSSFSYRLLRDTKMAILFKN